jgi:integrase
MQPTSAASQATKEKRFAFKAGTIDGKLSKLKNSPPVARLYWWDATRLGFGFRVSPTCTGVYVYRYRFDDKQRVMTLGTDFDKAKSAWRVAAGEAEVARIKRSEGKDALDPLDARREIRKQQRAIVETSKVRDVVDRFLADKKNDAELRKRGKAAAGKPLRDSTAGQYAQMFKLDFVELLGDRPIGKVKQKDIEAVCDRAKNRGAAATAARLLFAISSLYSWANDNGIVKGNPAKGISKTRYYRMVPRTRTLNNSEIKALFTFAGAEPSAVWLALLLTLATGQRSGELLQLRFVDVEDKAFVIPAAVSKTGNPHRVPLSPIAVEIVDELRLRAGGAEWLFPGKDPKAPMKQQSLGTALRRLHDDGKLTIEFRPHDLRRTLRTQLSALGVPGILGEMILGHEVRTDVEKHYDHHPYEDEKRAALERWSTRLCELRGRPAKVSNVVSLPRSASV